MQLAVNPDDVHAAGVALSGVATTLHDAVEQFVSSTRREEPDLGRDAADAAARSAAAAQQAGEVIVNDIRALARALKELAQVYLELDSTAMPGHR